MCVWLVLVGGGGQPNTYMAGDPQPYLVTNGSSLGRSSGSYWYRISNGTPSFTSTTQAKSIGKANLQEITEYCK